MYKSQIVFGLLSAVTAVLVSVTAVAGLLAQTAPTVTALVGGRVIASPELGPVDDAAVLIVGGRIVAEGTPEQVAGKDSSTGRYLRQLLDRKVDEVRPARAAAKAH